jgi:hypothetical protein
MRMVKLPSGEQVPAFGHLAQEDLITLDRAFPTPDGPRSMEMLQTLEVCRDD